MKLWDFNFGYPIKVKLANIYFNIDQQFLRNNAKLSISMYILDKIVFLLSLLVCVTKLWISWFMQQAGSLSVLLEPDQFEWKSNFLIIDIREGNINDNSKLLILPINVLLINNLVAPAIFQIKEDKEQYCIGVEICFFAQTSCHEICLAALIVKISTKIWRPIVERNDALATLHSFSSFDVYDFLQRL